MRWDLANLHRDLGFEPQDCTTPQVPLASRIRAGFAYLRDAALPAIGLRLAGRRW